MQDSIETSITTDEPKPLKELKANMGLRLMARLSLLLRAWKPKTPPPPPPPPPPPSNDPLAGSQEAIRLEDSRSVLCGMVVVTTTAKWSHQTLTRTLTYLTDHRVICEMENADPALRCSMICSCGLLWTFVATTDCQLVPVCVPVSVSVS